MTAVGRECVASNRTVCSTEGAKDGRAVEDKERSLKLRRSPLIHTLIVPPPSLNTVHAHLVSYWRAAGVQ